MVLWLIIQRMNSYEDIMVKWKMSDEIKKEDCILKTTQSLMVSLRKEIN